jgi:hypothetical protein
MSKKQPKITHAVFDSQFHYSPEGNKTVALNYNLTLHLENTKADGADKFRILQDIKEAIEAVKAKYE